MLIRFLLHGKQISLTSDNTTIASTNFNVDKDGNMSCSNANISGTITSSNARITGGKLLLYGGSENDPVFQISANHGYTKIVGSYLWLNGGYSPAGISVGYNLNDGNSMVYMGSNSSGGSITVGNGNISNFFDVAGYDNRVTIWGPVYANSFNNNSKEELKKNIELYNEKAINLIKNSNIYKFNYKTEKDVDKKHLGFIIGKKYKTPDEVISQNNESIDTYSMCSVLWKAMQEQIEQIEELQKKDKEKDEIIKDLLKRIERLEGK